MFGMNEVPTLVPMSRGALTRAHAVKWVFASSYVRSPLPISSYHLNDILSTIKNETFGCTYHVEIIAPIVVSSLSNERHAVLNIRRRRSREAVTDELMILEIEFH